MCGTDGTASEEVGLEAGQKLEGASEEGHKGGVVEWVPGEVKGKEEVAPESWEIKREEEKSRVCDGGGRGRCHEGSSWYRHVRQHNRDIERCGSVGSGNKGNTRGCEWAECSWAWEGLGAGAE